jgi:hypothetical protein
MRWVFNGLRIGNLLANTHRESNPKSARVRQLISLSRDLFKTVLKGLLQNAPAER